MGRRCAVQCCACTRCRTPGRRLAAAAAAGRGQQESIDLESAAPEEQRGTPWPRDACSCRMLHTQAAAAGQVGQSTRVSILHTTLSPQPNDHQLVNASKGLIITFGCFAQLLHVLQWFDEGDPWYGVEGRVCLGGVNAWARREGDRQ